MTARRLVLPSPYIKDARVVSPLGTSCVPVVLTSAGCTAPTYVPLQFHHDPFCPVF